MATDTRIFRDDPATGILEIFHYDEATDETTIQTLQDCTGIVEMNKAEYNMHDERTPFGMESFHKVASIPISLYTKWQKEGVIDMNGETDLKTLRTRLNDGDFRAFRTRPGKL